MPNHRAILLVELSVPNVWIKRDFNFKIVQVPGTEKDGWEPGTNSHELVSRSPSYYVDVESPGTTRDLYELGDA